MPTLERKVPQTIPEFTLGDSDENFTVVKRNYGVKSHNHMDPTGIVHTTHVEPLEPILDPRIAEAQYIEAGLRYSTAKNQFDAYKALGDDTTDNVEADMELIERRLKYYEALDHLLESGADPEDIKRISNRQITTQISNLGLGHIGEPVPSERRKIPFLDRAVDKRVRRNEEAKGVRK